MNKEEIYKFNNLWVSYDKGTDNDRSCLMIGKADKTNIYVLGELYDESADIFSAIINQLQQENKRLLELCMYSLISSTSIYKHELANDTKQVFMKIIRDNINLDTYSIREKIKKYWKGDNNE